MRQYLGAKEAHPDSVLLFRMGDFWETFYEDAETFSRVLGIALTTRGTEKGEGVPLAGVPLRSLEASVSRLVTAGLRVAVCDQVEDAAEAKGLVRREVVEVVSAGTATMPGLLEECESRYLAAVFPDADAGRYGVARCDLSTGEFAATEVAAIRLADELVRIAPSEILMPDGPGDDILRAALPGGVPVERVPLGDFPYPEDAVRVVSDGPGCASGEGGARFHPLAWTAAAGLLGYLESLKKAERSELAALELDEGEGVLVLDEISLRNLEILRPLQGDGTDGTLLSVVDRTRTPMGGRLLRKWLARPLLSVDGIAARQGGVSAFVSDGGFRDAVAEVLRGVGDLERLSMRIAAGRGHARDLRGLCDSLAAMPRLRELLQGAEAGIFADLAARIGDFSPEVDSIDAAIAEDPPLSLKDGGLFRDGFDAELDRVRSLQRDGKGWIAQLQSRERETTGIAKLKIGYNRVFGYYIEVSKTNRELVPDRYERRQTLVNAERYITPELKEREAEILGAEERGRGMEYEMFRELRERIARSCPRIRECARGLAAVDTLLSFAEVARRGKWICPCVDDSSRIEIRQGRHPVVEQMLPTQSFVPNDSVLDGEADGRQILLITGPNMAGKSTFLRQVALIVILAQTGSFVPAEAAQIGVVDRVFTRVGASDHVAAGRSTFMVEMVEVSRILSSATPRSLVLLDEVGRGTSTWDGLAIAWAVTEFLHDSAERCARTLFATHYHELTELAERLPRARNLRVTVHEWKEEIVFLRKVVEGGADRSFGIQVARLAGLPAEITTRARSILGGLEEGTFFEGRQRDAEARGSQLDLFSSAAAAVLSELATLHPEELTPMEALAVLAEWKRRTTGNDSENTS
jgi:DNA mismatch repair protein MutS